MFKSGLSTRVFKFIEIWCTLGCDLHNVGNTEVIAGLFPILYDSCYFFLFAHTHTLLLSILHNSGSLSEGLIVNGRIREPISD